MRICPLENEPADRCESGFYWNELACECFSEIYDDIVCFEDGQQLSPFDGYSCVDESIVDALFPSWADKYDRWQAELDGLNNLWESQPGF